MASFLSFYGDSIKLKSIYNDGKVNQLVIYYPNDSRGSDDEPIEILKKFGKLSVFKITELIEEKGSEKYVLAEVKSGEIFRASANNCGGLYDLIEWIQYQEKFKNALEVQKFHLKEFVSMLQKIQVTISVQSAEIPIEVRKE